MTSKRYSPKNLFLDVLSGIRFCRLGALLFFLLAAQVSGGAEQAPAEFDYKTALKISQQAIGTEIGAVDFIAADGSSLSLADFRGKPLIISMVYSSCYEICPMTTRHLAKVIKKAQEALGSDSFNAAVIGFDTQMDTPASMRVFALRQGIDNDPMWHALSMQPEAVSALSRDLGFAFYPTSQGFDHIIQASIIDANGALYRQVYGQSFATPLLVEPLIDLVLGKPKPAQSFTDQLFDKVRLFCTTYDPVRDGYFFDYSLFIGMLIGGVIILLGFSFIAKESFRSR